VSSILLAGIALLVIAVVLANLPFFSERLFLLKKPANDKTKSLGWRLAELLAYYGVTIGIGVLLEGRLGQIQKQGWQFYGITFCLFVVLAYPGFVIRYLKK
jgi:uncharacterized membrane protein YhaH (DUF805 family)